MAPMRAPSRSVERVADATPETAERVVDAPLGLPRSLSLGVTSRAITLHAHWTGCVLSVLGVFGCGESAAPADGAVPADARANTCTGGAAEFTLASGAYMTTGVSNITDGCGLGLTPAVLMSDRMVTLDGSGRVSLAQADNGQPLGEGTVRCNSGSLNLSGALQAGECQFASTRTSTVTVTANHQLTVQYTEMRSGFTSVAGMTCRQTTPCSVQYTLTLQR